MMRKDDWILDDLTWNDLDMNRNFYKMNRTLSMPGQQQLYNMLRVLVFDEEELKRRGRMIEFFQYNKEAAGAAALYFALFKQGKTMTAPLLCFIKGLRSLPSIRSWVLPALFGMIASLVSIPFMGVRAVVLVAIFFIMNMVIHNKINRYTEAAMPGIRYITRMLIAAREICALQLPGAGSWL